jgi:hypothetical protein
MSRGRELFHRLTELGGISSACIYIPEEGRELTIKPWRSRSK